MKRYIATLLTLSILCGLAACASGRKPAKSPLPESSTTQTSNTGINTTQTPSTQSVSTTTTPTVPALSVTERLQIYWEICAQLNQYADREYDSFGWRGVFVRGVPGGNEGLAYCYEFLRSMDDLKPYLNEDAWGTMVEQYTLPSQSPEELLARFTVIEDVLLEMQYSDVTVSHGTGPGIPVVIWRYDTNGNLVHLDQRDWSRVGDYQMPQHRFYSSIIHGDTFFEYDESGNCIANWLGKKNDLKHKIVPTYNDAGQLIREDDGDSVFLYEYDDYGQLSSVEYREPSVYDNQGNVVNYLSTYWIFEHTYDAAGIILQTTEKKVFDSNNPMYTFVSRFQYDREGRLCREDRDYIVDPQSPEKHLALTYTYDEKGRLLTLTTEYDPNQQSEVIRYTQTYVYGDQYVFDDYVIDFTEKNLK